MAKEAQGECEACGKACARRTEFPAREAERFRGFDDVVGAALCATCNYGTAIISHRLYSEVAERIRARRLECAGCGAPAVARVNDAFDNYGIAGLPYCKGCEPTRPRDFAAKVRRRTDAERRQARQESEPLQCADCLANIPPAWGHVDGDEKLCVICADARASQRGRMVRFAVEGRVDGHRCSAEYEYDEAWLASEWVLRWNIALSPVIVHCPVGWSAVVDPTGECATLRRESVTFREAAEDESEQPVPGQFARQIFASGHAMPVPFKDGQRFLRIGQERAQDNGLYVVRAGKWEREAPPTKASESGIYRHVLASGPVIIDDRILAPVRDSRGRIIGTVGPPLTMDGLNEAEGYEALRHALVWRYTKNRATDTEAERCAKRDLALLWGFLRVVDVLHHPERGGIYERCRTSGDKWAFYMTKLATYLIRERTRPSEAGTPPHTRAPDALR